MSADGSRVVVGAMTRDDPGGGGTDSGAAYVFARSGMSWSQEARLLAPGASTGDMFGSAVAMSLDATRVVVGAPSDDDISGASTTDSGAAYVFVRSLWQLWASEQKLLASDKATGASFGSAVAIDERGDRVVVGAVSAAHAAGGTLGAAYGFSRAASAWSEDQKIFARSGPSTDFGGAVAMDLAGSMVVVGAGRADDAGSGVTDPGAAYVWSEDADGVSCSLGSECGSGHCVDGVCCATSCGGAAADDCQACSEALTGVADGTCAPLSAIAAASVTCRAAAGACDVGESCAVGDPLCPPDSFASADAPCRAAQGACDVAEVCLGTSALCPSDAGAASGMECRASAGPCDTPETCDGSSTSCPADGFSQGQICRASNGACDLPEFCSGATAACPGDLYLPSGIVCRSSNGACDESESCTGLDSGCPSDAFVSAGTECRPAIGACDVAESCTGASRNCPLGVFVANGTACDDQATCTVSSACLDGTCRATLTLDCSDGDPCTADYCSEPDQCANAPIVGCTGPDAGVAADGGTDGGTEASPKRAGGCHATPGAPRSAWTVLPALLFAALLRSRRRAAVTLFVRPHTISACALRECGHAHRVRTNPLRRDPARCGDRAQAVGRAAQA